MITGGELSPQCSSMVHLATLNNRQSSIHGQSPSERQPISHDLGIQQHNNTTTTPQITSPTRIFGHKNISRNLSFLKNHFPKKIHIFIFTFPRRARYPGRDTRRDRLYPLPPHTTCPASRFAEAFRSALKSSPLRHCKIVQIFFQAPITVSRWHENESQAYCKSGQST